MFIYFYICVVCRNGQRRYYGNFGTSEEAQIELRRRRPYRGVTRSVQCSVHISDLSYEQAIELYNLYHAIKKGRAITIHGGIKPAEQRLRPEE